MIDLGCTMQFKAPFSSIFGVGALAFKVTEESEVPRTHKPLSKEDLLWLSNIRLCWNVLSWRTWEEKRGIKANFPCETCAISRSPAATEKAVPAFPWKFTFPAHINLGLGSSCSAARQLYHCEFCFAFFFFLIYAPQMRTETFRSEYMILSR